MDIISQNKDFFRTYPNIEKALLKVPKLPRGCWYDVNFLDGALFLFEMTKHKKMNVTVATDRIIMINEDGIIKDTREEI